jgi:signal transduction histidine kinase
LCLAEIRCRLDLPETPPHHALSTDVRHNLFLVVKEAVHNVVKHSHATEVWLRIALEGDRLRVTIEDNGVGFQSSPRARAGNGLVNMEKRIREIGGDFKLTTQPAKGAAITFTAPLSKRLH